MTNIKYVLVLYLKGMMMGIADLIPGVSGGTIAFITGIYSPLIASINAINSKSIQLIAHLKFKDFWNMINGNFILPLILGVVSSILLFAHLINQLLNTHSIFVWSFFLGLIFISGIIILSNIKKWDYFTIFSFLVGLLVAYFLGQFSPTVTPESFWFIFLSGTIAVCALILPGISGAFILLILGKYQFILNAINEKNLIVLGVFALGCVVGILTFAKTVNYLLKKFYDLTISILSGFMFGSLSKVWPWKVIVHSTDGYETKSSIDVLPNNYSELTNKSAMILPAIGFMIMGIMIVLIIHKFSKKK